MTSSYSSLLATILARPDDDTPRLVMADFLRENGDEARADFIEVQVELAEWYAWAGGQFLILPESRIGQQVEALRSRERELLESHPEWGRPLAVLFHPVNPLPGLEYGYGGCANPTKIIWEWHRGFICQIGLSWSDWLAHHAAIRAKTPLTKVRLATFPASTNRAGEWYWFDGDESNPVHIEELNGICRDGDSLTTALLRWRWPGIDFEFANENAARPATERSILT